MKVKRSSQQSENQSREGMLKGKVNRAEPTARHRVSHGCTWLWYMFVQTHVHGRQCDSILCAPSGLAALNINGSTIHSTFSVPVEHGSLVKYRILNKRAIDEMRAVMKNLRCIIVDEVSMVSNVLLLFMDLRMGEVFDPNSTFGGVKTFIAFGDLLQLPPVKADPPFVKLSANLVGLVTGGSKTSLNLWNKFKFAELTVNQRQKGDQNSEWRAILSRFRLGIKLPNDMKVLNDRCIEINGENVDEKLRCVIDYFCRLLNSGENATCLLPTRSMTDRFNNAFLKKQHTNAFPVMAVDTVDCTLRKNVKRAWDAINKLDKMDDPRHTGGLEKCVNMCIGVRVMLRQNLDTRKGLVNGVIGTITGFDKTPDDEVTRISIKFDNQTDETLIERVRRKVQLFPGAYLHREMFPICLSYAMTIHKSQGLTLKCVLANLGKKYLFRVNLMWHCPE